MGLFRSRKTSELGEHPIFGNEEAAQLRADVQLVTDRVDELAERVSAQFTSISAHAEISRGQIEQVRDEARADMERSRETVIGLLDRLRDEIEGEAPHRPGTPPGPSSIALNERFDQIEQAVEQLTERLDDCLARQQRVAETVTAFIDTMLSQSRDEPLLGLALT